MNAPWTPPPAALALIEKFKQDFSSLERPSDPIPLGTFDVDEIGDYYLERQWFEIDVVSIYKAHWDIGGALTDMFYDAHEYFVYFIPGYILMCLRDDPDEVNFFWNWTLYALTCDDPERKPYCFKDDPRGWERVFDAYTATQKEDIALFLRYVIEHDPSSCWDAGKAYHSYWGRFDPHTLFPVPADLPRRHRAYSPPYTLHRWRDSSIKDT